MSISSDNACIFNIQKFCIHDGPGIRTLVFFKGCPFHCQWCSNPEGISPSPELAYKKSKCIGIEECGLCIPACPQNALRKSDDGKIAIDRQACSNCMDCANVCPSHAMEQMGKYFTIDEVIHRVTADGAFYYRSGGGLTLSGGEPLLQADFAAKLLLRAHEEGLNTSIETTGSVEWKKACKVFAEIDTVFFDLKIFNAESHRKWVGAGNDLALSNFSKLCKEFPHKKITVRTPVIPYVNDSVVEIQKIVNYISQTGANANIQYELLPFHNYGSSKYEFIGKKYNLLDYKSMETSTVQSIKREIISDIPLL